MIDVKFSLTSQLDLENINIYIFITFCEIIHQAKTMTANVMAKIAVTFSSEVYKHKHSKHKNIGLNETGYRLMSDKVEYSKRDI